ncbi:MBL fold metallo-hydrolase [Sulfurimonas sp. SAG-AH-194-I05]|nr:MBL fold metallo-hydrolase [Sulfurimonas sp. SAG-AH-194-I05]MDF1875145.1 MBL fold metallo-hydrolase [Sulfurimonas sp. SAG-AH-194-I05]
MKYLFFLFIASSILYAQKIELEILGSGGPEIDGRASSSYLLWIDNKARLLIDMGSGSMLRFEQSNAKLESLQAVVLTHLHIDHSVDLPSFIKAGYFSQRVNALDIIAPFGNEYFPSIDAYLQNLFGANGAYRYMQDVLTPQSDSFQILPVTIHSKNIIKKYYKDFSLELINVYHGTVPALAVRITIGDKSILISGDTNNKNANLEKIAKNVDLFIAHHAIAQHAGKYAKRLHITPKQIAHIAHVGNVKKLVLSHRMKRTRTKEEESLKIISKKYKGIIIFAEDSMKIEL